MGEHSTTSYLLRVATGSFYIYNQPVIININKPRTWTSNDVVTVMKKKLNTKHVGHAGTLDPLATGVLLVLTEKDTKKQLQLMDLKKEYVAEVVFGAFSPTYDMEMMPVLADNILSFDQVCSALPAVVAGFIGEQDQTAPAFSAKKVGGKVLYREARRGKINELKLPVKRITIFNIDIMVTYETLVDTDKGLQKLPTAKLKIVCSSGTYIRSLAVDLGKALGTTSVMYSLVRTAIGSYTLAASQELKDFKVDEKITNSVESALPLQQP